STLVRQVSAAYRGLGLRRDDRVLLVASDEIPMLACILAAFHTGLVAVPVSTMFTGPELGKIVADSGARLVVCTEEFAGTVAEALDAAPEVELVVQVGDLGPLTGSNRYVVHDWDAFVE